MLSIRSQAQTHGIFITSGGSITTTGASLIVIKNGDFINKGTFTASSSNTVVMSGTTADSIGGTGATIFNNLTIDNSAGIVITSNALTTVTGSLTINSGMILEVAPGKQLTVTGSITNSGGNSGFILHSSASGTASLIHNTNNVPATMERYISGATEAWHFLSSPVSAQSFSGTWIPSGTYGNGTGYDLYLWNEPSSCWIYKLDLTSTINWGTVHPGSDFVVGRGYLYSVQASNPTKAFAGNLNNASVSYGLTFSSTDLTLKGFNLVGNPYASSLDWRAASGWDRSKLISSGGGYDMWIWSPSASNYGVYNSADGDGVGTNSVTRYIAPMQGYFVLASASGNMIMDNTVRIHTGANNWSKGRSEKGPDVNKVSLVIKSDAGYGTDEIQLGFGYPQNENGAMKLFSRVLTAPSMYLNSDGKNLSVKYYTDTNENPEVPLMFTPGITGKYTILCNFDQSKFETVMLEDRQLHYIQNVKIKNTYTFQSLSSDNSDRFVLHFGPIKDHPSRELPARIYSDGKQLIIDLTLVSKETEVSVFDLTGRILLRKRLPGEIQNNIDLNSNTRMLLVCLRNPDGSLSRKLIWEKR